MERGQNPMKMCDRKEGFTLIELLVVISIIAVLAAILFPVFTAARRSAFKTVCCSNLKQFGMAFRMYANDWDGRYPIPGGVSGTNCWLNSSGEGVNATQNSALWPYIGSKINASNTSSNLWSCPLTAEPTGKGMVRGYSPGVGYTMNDYFRAGHGGEIGQNYSNSPNYAIGLNPDKAYDPSKLILLYESVQNKEGIVTRLGSPYFCGTSASFNNLGTEVYPDFSKLLRAGLPQNFHGGMSSFLFADGHVQVMRPESTWTAAEDATIAQMQYGGREMSQVYHGTGEVSLWNPKVPGVNYP